MSAYRGATPSASAPAATPVERRLRSMQDPLRFMVIPFILPIIRAARRTSEVHHGRGRISTLGVCEVVASERSGYVAGDIVLAPTGWRTPPTLIAARRGQQGAGPSKFPVLKIPFPVIASRGSERSGVYHINHILSDSSCARGPRRPARAAGAAAAASSSRSMEFGRSSPSRSAAQAALDSNQLRGHRQQIGQSAALTVGRLLSLAQRCGTGCGHARDLLGPPGRWQRLLAARW